MSTPIRWFADRTVGVKILAAVLTAAAVALLVGGVAVSQFRSLASHANALYLEGVVPLKQLADINLAQDDARREVLSVLAAQSQELIDDNLGDVRGADARFLDGLAAYREHAVEQGGGRVEHVDELVRLWKDYTAVRDAELLPLAVATKLREFEAAQEAQAAPGLEKVEEGVLALVAIEDAAA